MSKNNINGILSVRNLSFAYNQHRVIDNISFSLNQGDFIAILGPNGAGKSTLINIISKVVSGYSGNIFINGFDSKKLGPKQLAKMLAVVPQYTTPSFDFTVYEMVKMGRYPYLPVFGTESREDLEIVRQVIEKTRIKEFADRRFNELSGGEKQRVTIAQALAQNSPILFLDEPTSHLDINFQIEFMNLFLKLNKEEGRTVVGIFHDINLAIQNSNKIMLLKDGKIFGYGPAEEVISRPNIMNVFHSNVFIGRNPVTNKLYVSPVFEPGLFSEDRSRAKGKDIRIHVIGGGGAASQILNLLYNHGYTISCGVVNTFDSDLDTARMLDVPYVIEAPFSPISPDSQNKNLEFIKSGQVVILPEVAFGNGNFLNLVSVEEALSLGKKVIVMDREDIKKRDHTGGKAEKLYRKILNGGSFVCRSDNELFALLGKMEL